MTKVLLKTFVAGFYRAHAGLLLILFVTIFINFFFTNVLNQSHLDKEELLFNNLKLVLTSVSNPVAMGVLFLCWLGYTVKCCQFVSGQLGRAQNQFLFYSSTSLSLKKQFQTWLILQAIISLPIIVTGLFAVGVGIAFDYLLIPFVILIYLLILIFCSTYYYIGLVNNLNADRAKFDLLSWIKRFPKPFFSLFLYQIVYQFRIHYAVTKIISAVIIIGMYVLFHDSLNDIRTDGITMLSVVIAHTVLIYQSNEFDRSYLHFIRNFPLTKEWVYRQLTVHYFLLLLPEIIWFFFMCTPEAGLYISLLGISCALLFRTILYGRNMQMSLYLKMVFSLFILSVLSVIFGLLLWVTVVNMIISFFLFHRKYQGSADGSHS